MSASEKTTTLRAWIRFLKSGLKFEHFTKALLLLDTPGVLREGLRCSPAFPPAPHTDSWPRKNPTDFSWPVKEIPMVANGHRQGRLNARVNKGYNESTERRGALILRICLRALSKTQSNRDTWR
jgi:hypothetical protein